MKTVLEENKDCRFADFAAVTNDGVPAVFIELVELHWQRKKRDVDTASQMLFLERLGRAYIEERALLGIFLAGSFEIGRSNQRFLDQLQESFAIEAQCGGCRSGMAASVSHRF